jgi:hypothetical protein
MIRSWVGLTLLGASIALGFGEPSSTDPESSAAKRVVQTAIERAQVDLGKGIDLWVDHSSWDDPWVVNSDHYQIRTTHSRALGMELSRMLERQLEEFCGLLRRDSQDLPQPMPVFVFPTLQEYNGFGSPFGAHSSAYGSFFADDHAQRPVATFYSASWVHLWAAHSALHQLLHHTYPQATEVWLVEGLSSYFPLYWLFYDYSVRRFEKCREEGRLVALPELLEAPIEGYDDWSFLQIGMLYSYLMHFREQTKVRLQDDGTWEGPFLRSLLQALQSPQPERLSWREVFGENLAELQTDFHAFPFP